MAKFDDRRNSGLVRHLSRTSTVVNLFTGDLEKIQEYDDDHDDELKILHYVLPWLSVAKVSTVLQRARECQC